MKAPSKTDNKSPEVIIDSDTGLPIDILKGAIEKGVLSGPVDMSMSELREEIKRDARKMLK